MPEEKEAEKEILYVIEVLRSALALPSEEQGVPQAAFPPRIFLPNGDLSRPSKVIQQKFGFRDTPTIWIEKKNSLHRMYGKGLFTFGDV